MSDRIGDRHAGEEEYDEPLEATWDELEEIDASAADAFDREWLGDHAEAVFDALTRSDGRPAELAMKWARGREEHASKWSEDHQAEIAAHRRG